MVETKLFSYFSIFFLDPEGRFPYKHSCSRGQRRTVSSVGRAPPSHGGGHRFKSCTVHHYGAVVKTVITPACHAGGRGFESLPLRHNHAKAPCTCRALFLFPPFRILRALLLSPPAPGAMHGQGRASWSTFCYTHNKKESVCIPLPISLQNLVPSSAWTASRPRTAFARSSSMT